MENDGQQMSDMNALRLAVRLQGVVQVWYLENYGNFAYSSFS